jgi:hypothetical protein
MAFCFSPLATPSFEGLLVRGAKLLPTLTNELDTIWNLGLHHFPSIQLAPIHHEGAITNCVNGSLLFS